MTNEFSLLHSIGSLDQSGDYIFGEIKKVRIFNDSVFVFDSRSNHLKVYSLGDGTHLRTFELRGSGPGELLYSVDMIFDETEKQIYLLDGQGKFLQYHLSDDGSMELLHKRLLDFLPLNMCMTLNGFAFRARLSADDQNNGINGNIILWDDFTAPSEKMKCIGFFFRYATKIFDELSFFKLKFQFVFILHSIYIVFIRFGVNNRSSFCLAMFSVLYARQLINTLKSW